MRMTASVISASTSVSTMIGAGPMGRAATSVHLDRSVALGCPEVVVRRHDGVEQCRHPSCDVGSLVRTGSWTTARRRTRQHGRRRRHVDAATEPRRQLRAPGRSPRADLDGRQGGVAKHGGCERLLEGGRAQRARISERKVIVGRALGPRTVSVTHDIDQALDLLHRCTQHERPRRTTVPIPTQGE